MTIFNFLEDKDVFMKYCIQWFAHRLVSMRMRTSCYSDEADEAEASMIVKMKDICKLIKLHLPS